MRVDVIVGRTWHSAKLIGGLEELGNVVRVVSADEFDRPATRRIPMRTLLRAGDRVRPLTVPLKMVFGTVAAGSRRRPDLVVAWSSWALPSLLVRPAIPHVVVRGSHHIRTQLELLGRRQGPAPLAVRVEEAEYQRALMVSVPTEEIASDPYFGRGRAVARCAPYGFPALGPPTLSGRTGPVRILFAGELSYRKGIDRMIAAFGDPSADVEVWLAGSSGRRPRPLPAHWHHLGLLPHERLLEQMRQADCLVLPSREEGMARVGQEAMALGLPVVATPEAGLGKWLTGGGGVILSSSPGADELTAAVAQSRAGGAAMRSAAYATASSWSWRDHAELLLDQVAALR